MSKSMNSPTARLLRSSRLMTLPRPLPAPLVDTGSQGTYKHSPSATLPYPTHQAITTFPSSLLQGDFGLKRALPAKTTRRTSTPHIRVKAHDNTEHITAFESAADHTLTEAKWRQMGIPIFLAEDKDDARRHLAKVSAYDERYDNTHRNKEGKADGARWKREGPSLASMQHGEFEYYLENTLAPRKKEFETFLKERIVHGKVEYYKKDLLRGKAELDADDLVLLATETENIRADVDENFDNELKHLRDDQAMRLFGSDLTTAVAEFLDMDLPNFGTSSETSSAKIGIFSQDVKNSIDATNRRKEKEPMSTHPAAGLSFSLTNAIMENHPQYGPQDRRSPILARVLVPRNRTVIPGTKKPPGTVIGVGGVVSMEKGLLSKEEHQKNPAFEDIDRPEQDWMYKYRMSNKIEPDLEGGNKLWVHPESATIRPDGSIRIEVTPALEDETLIKIGRGDIVSRKKNTDPSSQMSSSASRIPASKWGEVLFRSRPSAAAPIGESIAEEHDDPKFLDPMKAAMRK